jgi:hypothetical protein
MNKGTLEGTEEEIQFVKNMNQKNDLNFWKILNLTPQDHYAVHCSRKIFGKINNSKILPKADVYFAKGNVDAQLIKTKDFYLNEDDCKKLELTKISTTGVSIKRIDSKKYQILKMAPSTFEKIFGSFELGAGASVYCQSKEELSKNTSVLTGWKTNWEKFILFFKFIKNINHLNDKNYSAPRTTLKEIKNWSNKEISNKINQNKAISDFVFKGIGNFEEPYIATWILLKNDLQPNKATPFVVTTGSGRSKGDFTIVIKPKL